MNIKYDKHIVEQALDKVEFKSNPKITRWVNIFNGLSESEKHRVLGYLEQEQARFIADSMKHLNKEIKLHRLGKFSVKHSREQFYKFKEKYPDKSIDEIRDMVVKDYVKHKKEMEQQKKINKSKKYSISKLHIVK